MKEDTQAKYDWLYNEMLGYLKENMYLYTKHIVPLFEA